jgi:hypothetical protein
VKKLLIVLICGLLGLPVAAWGQKWIEPYRKSDGTWVAGHWQTPAEVRRDSFSTPGKINPYTGQFTPYTYREKGSTGPPTIPPPFDPFAPQDYQRQYRYRVR